MTELLIVALLVLLNGFFAMSEMAVVTARKSKLRELAKRSLRARAASRLADEPDTFLSTVQVGITLVGILTGLVGGEAFGLVIAGWITQVAPTLERVAQPLGIGLAVAGITFVSLIFGELVPKRFALSRPETIAVRVAPVMRLVSMLAAPAVWGLSKATGLVLRMLGVPAQDPQRVTEEEIRLLVAESHEQGVIDADERTMMNRVIRLGDRIVSSLMTPRPRIVWLDAAASDDQNFQVMRATPFSRYPVFRQSDQDVLGILEVKSLAGQLGARRLALFRELRSTLFVSERTRALDLLDRFREEGASVALVVDEYGDIQGMVTINDVMGAVLGRLAAARGDLGVGLPVARREDGSLLVDGSLASDDLRELLACPELPHEHEHDYHTLAGLVMTHFGRIPQPGEYFDWGGWRFEVVDLDGARIDKLLLTPLPGGAGVEPE